jgi:hypothetical protein
VPVAVEKVRGWWETDDVTRWTRLEGAESEGRRRKKKGRWYGEAGGGGAGEVGDEAARREEEEADRVVHLSRDRAVHFLSCHVTPPNLFFSWCGQ